MNRERQFVVQLAARMHRAASSVDGRPVNLRLFTLRLHPSDEAVLMRGADSADLVLRSQPGGAVLRFWRGVRFVGDTAVPPGELRLSLELRA